MSNEQNCTTCRFWLEVEHLTPHFQAENRFGLCRRYAPSPRLLKDWDREDTRLAQWPATADVDGCGEWQGQQ